MSNAIYRRVPDINPLPTPPSAVSVSGSMRAPNMNNNGVRIQRSLGSLELRFSRYTTLAQLKQQFDKNFFYLKLEFFSSNQQSRDDSRTNEEIIDRLILGEIVETRYEGVFTYSRTTTVSEFEERMQRELGLQVKVFRKAAELWIDTTRTNHLSLDTQNKMGEGSSIPMEGNVHNLFL